MYAMRRNLRLRDIGIDDSAGSKDYHFEKIRNRFIYSNSSPFKQCPPQILIGKMMYMIVMLEIHRIVVIHVRKIFPQ